MFVLLCLIHIGIIKADVQRGRIDAVICRKYRLPSLTAGSTPAAGGLLFCRSGLFCAFVPFRHRCSGGIQSCRGVVLLRRLGRSCLGPTGWLKDIELPLFRHLSHPNCPFFFSFPPPPKKKKKGQKSPRLREYRRRGLRRTVIYEEGFRKVPLIRQAVPCWRSSCPS